ncbi:hypothetical protein BT96DRAFT_440047 [Gymnopus androsaceus JB14]|uniref:Uncharacterized protein n=1 Tax=Gymnopus androsaceus JB14 TaxID=1447944 RepID=A0A6A4I2C4_9AGAR|nr:hypothetical protein BT96DRAFT_440047 [Gymnopus androsaceus JB14]
MIFSVLRACCFLGILCLFIEASPVNSKLHTDCHIAHANASPDSTSKIDGAHVVHSEASCSSTASTLIDDPLQPTSEEIIIGYRYVEFEKAKEYNATKTLTAILASARSIGEGAYLSPKIGDFPGIFTPPWEVSMIFGLAFLSTL